MTSSQTAWLYLRLLKGIATYYSYNRPAGFCATSYNSVITVYSAASGSPHDAASICLVIMVAISSMVYHVAQFLTGKSIDGFGAKLAVCQKISFQ